MSFGPLEDSGKFPVYKYELFLYKSVVHWSLERELLFTNKDYQHYHWKQTFID